MKRSNIKFIPINESNQQVANKKTLKFDIDKIEEVPVYESTRDLICIGNIHSHSLKIQFTIKEME